MNNLPISIEPMPMLNKNKIRQCREENDSWKRVLVFLQGENNYLKIRLAHLTDQEVSMKFLARAENLQNELIQKDELIALTRPALSDFDKCLSLTSDEDDDGVNEVLRQRKKLRHQIEHIELAFSRHKAGFNDSLTENL
jgi:hypothetical protein